MRGPLMVLIGEMEAIVLGVSIVAGKGWRYDRHQGVAFDFGSWYVYSDALLSIMGGVCLAITILRWRQRT